MTPMLPEISSPTSQRVQASRHSAEPDTRRARLDVLVVEDDPADASLILSALHQHPDVLTARGIAAPARAHRELAAGRIRPDLVLLDLHMPLFDGFAFLKGLRRIPELVSLPVVFLTTSNLDDDVLRYMDSSA